MEDFEAETFTQFFFNEANQMTGIQTENTTGAVVEEGGLSEASLAEIAVSPGNVTTDPNGNITEIVQDDETYSFSFDYENRLIEARYLD